MSMKVKWPFDFPEHWEILPAKRLFPESKERALESDKQLSATQEYGVIAQAEFMRLAGRRVVQINQNLDLRKRVEVGDFVISMRSFQGGLERAWAADGIRSSYVVLKPRLDLVPGYYQRFFKSEDYIQALQSTANFIRDGQDLNYQNFVLIDLPFPPISEQTKIARFLDHETARIDALIAEQKRLIELLKEKRQAVISHAVTKGLDPTAPMKDSGVEWLGEVPAHWEMTRIGWQCLVGNGCTPSRDNLAYWDNGDYPWLNSSKVNLERVIEADQFVTQQALKACALPIVKPGTVLIAITGEGKTRGMATITEIEATINQHLAFIERRDKNLSHEFLHDWLSANYLRIRHESEGWGSTKAAITCSDIRSFTLPLPAIHEQEDICRFIQEKSSLLNELISQSEENMCLLQERRSALISAAVTGKIDVRGWQAPASVSPAHTQSLRDSVDVLCIDTAP